MKFSLLRLGKQLKSLLNVVLPMGIILRKVEDIKCLCDHNRMITPKPFQKGLRSSITTTCNTLDTFVLKRRLILRCIGKGCENP